MKKAIRFKRCKNKITEMFEGKNEDRLFSSISKAKKESRNLQQKFGYLGDGSLMVKRPPSKYTIWAKEVLGRINVEIRRLDKFNSVGILHEKN